MDQTAAPKVTRAEQYSKLLTVVSRIMVQLKKTCTTEQCAALSEEGVALVADGQPKAAKGWLIEEERLNFHDKLESLLTRTIAAIQSRKTAETKKLRLPDGSTCRRTWFLTKTAVTCVTKCSSRPQKSARCTWESVRRVR